MVQAEGASPLYRAFKAGGEVVPLPNAQTIATAIKIGNPVSAKKSLRAIRETGGVVESVTDQQTMDAKGMIDAAGIGCEPASAVTVAGLRKLTTAGTVKPDQTVACILTGHVLKDPDATAKYHRDELREGHDEHIPSDQQRGQRQTDLRDRVPTIGQAALVAVGDRSQAPRQVAGLLGGAHQPRVRRAEQAGAP